MVLLAAMSGTARLMATLIYGGGLRVTECCELRIKDIDFDQGLVFVRRGKGNRDRSTLFAEVGRDDLRAHLREVEAQHHPDRRAGLAGVWMPDALDRKYPNAGRELAWLWVFPSKTLSTDPRADSGIPRAGERRDDDDLHPRRQGASQSGPEPARHPSHPCPSLGLQRAGVHILRHTFCLHLAMKGAPVRAIQELAGHADLSTTQRYMHLSPAATEDAIRLLDSTTRRPQCRAAAWRHCGDERGGI